LKEKWRASDLNNNVSITLLGGQFFLHTLLCCNPLKPFVSLRKSKNKWYIFIHTKYILPRQMIQHFEDPLRFLSFFDACVPLLTTFWVFTTFSLYPAFFVHCPFSQWKFLFSPLHSLYCLVSLIHMWCKINNAISDLRSNKYFPNWNAITSSK